MSPLYDRLSPEKKKDIRVLANFIGIFCRENHRAGDKKEFSVSHPELQAQLPGMVLCSECSRLLEHGIAKLSLCSQNPKPSCRKCKTHCYSPGYRDRVRKVMRFSGMYLVRHGRLDLLLHYVK